MNTVDTGVLAELETLGGREFVTTLLATAIDTMRAEIAEIVRGADDGDILGVGRKAHGLISTAGAVGATRIREAAAAIEAQANRGLLDPADEHIAGLATELRAFENDVRGRS
jgi:HPt (histidine-containing phosphotransfer) domain-containing protein